MSETPEPELRTPEGGIWIDFEDETGDHWFPTLETMIAAMLVRGVDPAQVVAAMAAPQDERVYVSVAMKALPEPLEYPVVDWDAGIEFVLKFAEAQGVDSMEAMTTLEGQKMEGLAELEIGPFRIYAR